MVPAGPADREGGEISHGAAFGCGRFPQRRRTGGGTPDKYRPSSQYRMGNLADSLTFPFHMKKLVLFALLFAFCLSHAFSAVYFVAVDGNDHGPGSKLQPFATVQRAQSAARPGDTVYLRGGVYHLTEAQLSQTERGYACVSYLD